MHFSVPSAAKRRYYQYVIRRAVLALVAITASTVFAETVEFSGQVRAGDTFTHRLPRDLLFCLLPFSDSSGWLIAVATTCEPTAKNLARIATPPYRGVNPIQLSGWHFLPDVRIFSQTRVFQFVLNSRDYQTILDMLRSEHDAGVLLKLVDELGIGTGEFRVLKSETTPGIKEEPAKLVHLRFSAKLTFP